METIGYIYALVVEVIKGNITAEEALEKIRKYDFGKKALARKRGRRDDFRGEKVAPRPGVNFSHLQI